MEVKWVFAKSYAADAAHEYVIRGRVPVDFFEFYKEKLKTDGVWEEFTLRGRTARYKYFYEGEFKYWIVGPVLNRAKLVR
jgi:hypothetical protein